MTHWIRQPASLMGQAVSSCSSQPTCACQHQAASSPAGCPDWFIFVQFIFGFIMSDAHAGAWRQAYGGMRMWCSSFFSLCGGVSVSVFSLWLCAVSVSCCVLCQCVCVCVCVWCVDLGGGLGMAINLASTPPPPPAAMLHKVGTPVCAPRMRAFVVRTCAPVLPCALPLRVRGSVCAWACASACACWCLVWVEVYQRASSRPRMRMCLCSALHQCQKRPKTSYKASKPGALLFAAALLGPCSRGLQELLAAS